RSGGITLEYASPHPAPAERDLPDRLHGVSYRVRDLAAHCAHLTAAGLDVSPVRPGMRPGTSVATVRSGTAGVPTLLLEVHAGVRRPWRGARRRGPPAPDAAPVPSDGCGASAAGVFCPAFPYDPLRGPAGIRFPSSCVGMVDAGGTPREDEPMV